MTAEEKQQRLQEINEMIENLEEIRKKDIDQSHQEVLKYIEGDLKAEQRADQKEQVCTRLL